MSDRFDLSEALEENGTVETVRTLLGLRREAHTCPECNVACEQATTHDPQRAAFDGGESPSWECPDCDTHYVREATDDVHTLDLYGHGRE